MRRSLLALALIAPLALWGMGCETDNTGEEPSSAPAQHEPGSGTMHEEPGSGTMHEEPGS